MDPKQVDRLIDLAQVVAGWVMGFLTPAILERFARSNRKELKGAPGVELRELQFTIALVPFRLARRRRAVTAERIALVKEVIDAYKGPEEHAEG